MGRCILAMALATLGGLSFAPSARAQAYYFIGLTESSAVVADRDSIQWRDNRPQMTLHFIHRTPFVLERSYGGDVYIQRTAMRYDFDCDRDRSRTLKIDAYAFGQSTYTPNTLSETTAWEALNPTSTLEIASNMACHNQVPDSAEPSELGVIIRAYYATMNDQGDD